MLRRTNLKRTTPLQRKPMKRKRRKGDDLNARLAYFQEHDSCGICWRRWSEFGANNQTHHIVGGSGRKDVRANLFTICEEHHDLYHRGFGLTPGMILSAKMEQDPDGYDEAVILNLLGRQSLPERWLPVPIPEQFLKLRERR